MCKQLQANNESGMVNVRVQHEKCLKFVQLLLGNDAQLLLPEYLPMHLGKRIVSTKTVERWMLEHNKTLNTATWLEYELSKYQLHVTTYIQM